MSRIGKLPITLPAGVSLEQNGNRWIAKGPKGELQASFLPNVSVSISDGVATITRANDSLEARAAHGLTRQLLANMVIGVSEGFEKRLEMKGVGYRATAEGEKRLVLSVGYSHPVIIEAPAGISFKVEKNMIVISGIDKQAVGQIAAEIRRVRPPEPYKGKGIMYQGKIVRRKAGKTAKAGA